MQPAEVWTYPDVYALHQNMIEVGMEIWGLHDSKDIEICLYFIFIFLATLS
jgi:hypothetical protein